MTNTLPCWIYKSSKKDEMYLYLRAEAAFDQVPKPLMARFGQPTLVMELALDPERKLARVDVAQVMSNLRENGFFLQMPPELKPALYHGNED